jgi:hypothetical protein
MAMLKQAAAAAEKSKAAAPPVADQDEGDEQPDDKQQAPEPDDSGDDAQQPPDQDADAGSEGDESAPEPGEGGDASDAGPSDSDGGDKSDQGGSSGNGPLDQIQKPATPQLQKEFNRAVMALHTVLYSSTKISALAVKMVQPAQIVDSTSKCCILIVNQLDRKLRLDPQVIPQFTMAVVDEVMDMIQKVKQINYTPPQQKAILGATFEGVMKMFGVKPQEAQQFLQSLSDPQKTAARQQYVSDLNEAKTASPSAAQGSAPENTPEAPEGDEGGEGEGPPPDASASPDDQGGAPDEGAAPSDAGDQGAAPPSPDEGQ